MSEIFVNDVDLADYGFVMGVNPKHASSPTFSDASAPLLGNIGPVWAGDPVQAAARQLIVGGHMVAATESLLRTNVDILKALFTLGAVRLRFADRVDQEFRGGRLVSFDATPKAALLHNAATDLQAVFGLADVLRYDLQPSGFALTTSRTALPMGTAPTFPIISINGGGASLTNPVITYRDAAGNIQQTMSLIGTLGANDRIVVDSKGVSIALYTAGVKSDALSWWPVGSGDFIKLRAADAAYEQSGWPTLELSASAGTPFGRVTYSRANL